MVLTPPFPRVHKISEVGGHFKPFSVGGGTAFPRVLLHNGFNVLKWKAREETIHPTQTGGTYKVLFFQTSTCSHAADRQKRPKKTQKLHDINSCTRPPRTDRSGSARTGRKLGTSRPTADRNRIIMTDEDRCTTDDNRRRPSRRRTRNTARRNKLRHHKCGFNSEQPSLQPRTSEQKYGYFLIHKQQVRTISFVLSGDRFARTEPHSVFADRQNLQCSFFGERCGKGKLVKTCRELSYWYSKTGRAKRV